MRVRAALGALLAGACLAGCQGLRGGQRAPAPMPLREADDLPPPDPAPGEGPTTLVTRHADPVEVRRPGALDVFPLRFWDKTLPVAAGSEVHTRGGGRAELSWEGDATTVVLSDAGALRVGDPQEGEPLVRFLDVTHARMTLTPEDVIGLPGGAELRGDDETVAGPFVLRRVSYELVRLTNQSRRNGLLRYRDVAVELGPGETVDLPLVGGGSAPLGDGREPSALERGGLRLAVVGAVEALAGERTAQVDAVEDARLEALGVQVSLRAGERATFSSMRRRLPGEAEAEPIRAAPEPPTAPN